ncbi:MAG: xanthine dehydrogenase family protein subunit M [Planctomycetes bacterium]|nr:xanthine dehydrogenase family protein subunit M [Planctomycetota bacterium]
MYLPDLELHQPETLEDAAGLMRRHAPAARYLAGGTDLLVDLKVARVAARHLISVNRISGMRSIEVTEAGLAIGSLATLTELNDAPLPGAFAAIKDATSRMAAPHIRNVATVGGNLASAVPCADLPPILTVMNGRVGLFSPAGVRDVPLADFFTGPRCTLADDDEILVRITVPVPPARFGAAYARFALREGNSIAVASVAASLVLDDSGTIREACLSMGAVAPIPMRVDEAAAGLIGRRLDAAACADAAEAAMRAADPISDIRGSARFRRELCGVLAKRALQKAAHRIESAHS